MEVIVGNQDGTNARAEFYYDFKSVDWLPWMRFRTNLYNHWIYEYAEDEFYIEGKDFGIQLDFGWLFVDFVLAVNFKIPSKRRLAE